MSLGNEYDQALHLESLKDTIAANISEGAKKAQSFFSLASFYKVPNELRNLKESAYTPRLIAIGPLHRNNKHLKTPMQYVKMSYTNCLLRRQAEGIMDPELANQIWSTGLIECIAKMKHSIYDAKTCYAEEVMVDEEMLLVDGCFIIELFYGISLTNTHVHGGDSGNSQIFVAHQKIPTRPTKKRLNDLTLALFHKVINPKDNSTTSCGLPSDHVFLLFDNKTESSKEKEGNYYHVLHKLHEHYLPLHQTKETKLTEHMPSASNLNYAGVKFVGSIEKDLFNVKFHEPKGPFWWCHRALFEIPTLAIYDHTEAFLRNIIAFEQCCPRVPKQFTSYAHLMDKLVNSEKDVERLAKNGVIRNYLGANEDATKLFNKLCKETILGEFFFADTCNKATKYSKRCWPKNMAHLRRTYFASPWTFIAFCLGFIAFGMSVTQFIHSFLK